MAKPNDQLDRIVKSARRALHPDSHSYPDVQRVLDEAAATGDPALAAKAREDAMLLLAKIATGPNFNAQRHRAIAQALREAPRLRR